MSELESPYVKQGMWTNIDNGRVLGQSITTDNRTGILIVALLAVFTTLGLSHLFTLILFVCHQVRADGEPADGLFRQQQTLLRTLPTPSTLCAESVKLWFLWRSISNRVWQRSIGFIILAASFMVGLVVVSVFSSNVVDNNSIEVLVDSSLCGSVNTTSTEDNLQWPYVTSVNALAYSYADDCYTNTTSLPSRCTIFLRPRIGFRTEDVPCPFDNGVCLGPAVAFDSGLIDVGKAFGINLPPKDRVKFRKRDTCGILSQEGRVRHINTSDLPEEYIGRKALPGEEELLYAFGKTENSTEWGNYTFGISLYASNITGDYQSNFAVHYADPAISSSIEPLSEMERPDGDLVLRFLSKNAVLYAQPVDDPMFSAHKPVTIRDTSQGVNKTLYLSDSHATVVGCIEQYQYCIIDSSGAEICSPLQGISPSANSSQYPGTTSTQLSVLRLLSNTGLMFSLSKTGRIKTAVTSGIGGLVGSLPNDQWKTEIGSWEADVWAAYQIAIPDYAIGPQVREPKAEAYTVKPISAGDRALCRMQKMHKSGGFVNINVFGLEFVLVVSGTVALLDIVMLHFLIYLSPFQRVLSPRIERWTQQSGFQQLRRLYEAMGEGSWTRLDKEVPLLNHNTLLSDLSSLPGMKTVKKCTSSAVVESRKDEASPKLQKNANEKNPPTPAVESKPDSQGRESIQVDVGRKKQHESGEEFIKRDTMPQCKDLGFENREST